MGLVHFEHSCILNYKRDCKFLQPGYCNFFLFFPKMFFQYIFIHCNFTLRIEKVLYFSFIFLLHKICHFTTGVCQCFISTVLCAFEHPISKVFPSVFIKFWKITVGIYTFSHKRNEACGVIGVPIHPKKCLVGCFQSNFIIHDLHCAQGYSHGETGLCPTATVKAN